MGSPGLTSWQWYRLDRACRAERDGGLPALSYSARQDEVLVERGLLWRDGERLRVTDAGRKAVRPPPPEREDGEDETPETGGTDG